MRRGMSPKDVKIYRAFLRQENELYGRVMDFGGHQADRSGDGQR